MGIGFVPEHMGIFTELTVEENMRVAMLVEDDATAARLERILEMFAALKKFWKSKGRDPERRAETDARHCQSHCERHLPSAH